MKAYTYMNVRSRWGQGVSYRASYTYYSELLIGLGLNWFLLVVVFEFHVVCDLIKERIVYLELVLVGRPLVRCFMNGDNFGRTPTFS